MMSAGPLLERRDVFAAFDGEARGKLLTLANGLKECAWPQTSANDQPANPVCDVNNPIDKFDFWRRFQQNRGLEVSSSKHNAPLTSTRRISFGASEMNFAFTSQDLGKTPKNGIVIHAVPLRDNLSTNCSTNGCDPADIAGAL